MNTINETLTETVVLVVDDDEMARIIARTALETDGFSVIEAENGIEAVARFHESLPDIVLMDVEMPELDGFSACQQIRAHDFAGDVPILLITGLEDVGSIEKAYEVEATDFTTKPVNWTILTHRIRYILRSSELFKELKKSQGQLSEAQRIAQICYWEWDISNDEVQLSKEFSEICGKNLHEHAVRLTDILELAHPDDQASLNTQVNSRELIDEAFSFEFRLVRPSGELRYVTAKGHVLNELGSKAQMLVGTLQDITSLRLTEEKIHYLAYNDTLTGLPNRESFHEKLELAITNARATGSNFAMAYMDLDDFKRVNDTLGHSAGDLLLQETVSRIGTVVRSGDALARKSSSDDLIDQSGSQSFSRVGGDEFTLLLTEQQNIEDTYKIIERVLASFSRPYRLANSSGTSSHEVFTTASVGIAVYPDDGTTVEELLKNADTAMFQAKRMGKNTYRRYMPEMNVRSMQRLSTETKLRRAMEKNELDIHYQLKFDSTTSKPTGAEALLRWHNEEFGNIPPIEFIPIAEETGLIIPIGEWVMEAACRQTLQWQEEGFEGLVTSVNLSGVQFRQKDLDARLRDIVERVGLAPKFIELELTETMIMSHAEENIRVLQRFKDIGFKLAVDDFGTGYSSLAYLKRFPLDTLKIDRAFVKDIEDDDNDRIISTVITSLGHSLGMEVVAEGVETVGQLALLRAMGCDTIQGYLLAKPMSADAVSEKLKGSAVVSGVSV